MDEIDAKSVMNGLSNSPFPGMNPWLEHPSLWGDVHFRLIAALANYLSPLLVPYYYVAVGTHTYVTTLPNTPSIHYPDVAVVETKPGGIVRTPATSSGSTAAEPVMVEVPLADTVEESYLEIREPVIGSCYVVAKKEHVRVSTHLTLPIQFLVFPCHCKQAMRNQSLISTNSYNRSTEKRVTICA